MEGEGGRKGRREGGRDGRVKRSVFEEEREVETMDL